MYDSQGVIEPTAWPASMDIDPRPSFDDSGPPSQPKQRMMKGDPHVGEYQLRLYVAGETVISQKARENLRQLCERCGPAVEALVIDVLSEPSLADKARILATPTLVRDQPARSKRVIGDLSDIEKVIEFLGLQQRDEWL